MPKGRNADNLKDMMKDRLNWALTSSLDHFLHRPDRNSIEDWANDTAEDICTDIPKWVRLKFVPVDETGPRAEVNKAGLTDTPDS